MTKLCPRGKAAAKRKFKVYPSAYANAYASKICAGKAKDPSGVKKKDWGPKKANKGAMMKKFNKGDEVKVKRIDPLAERMSKTGFVPGGGKRVSKAKVKKKKKLTEKQVLAIKYNQIPISTRMEGKKYGLKIPTKRYDSKGKDKFKQFKKLVLKKRDRKNPARDFLPVAGQPTRREAHVQTYRTDSTRKTKKKYSDKFYDYSKGGKVMKNKPIKAGKGMLMPIFGLAGMMKYMQMNKKKSGTVSPDANAVDPITGKSAGQSQNIQDFGKQAVNTGLKNKFGARRGKLARKPKKAGLGMLMLMNHMKKQGKKEGRKQAAQGEAEVLAAKNAAEQNSGMSKMNQGGYVSGSYIRDDSDYSETNSSTSNYYKDMLD